MNPPAIIPIDSGGFARGARFIPSPNQDERPPEQPVELLVVHAISLPPKVYGGDAVERFFTNRLPADGHPFYSVIADLRVSSHFFIRRDGELLQFVSARRRAWHAGISRWQGRDACNDFAIGVELEGSDFDPFEDAQYHTLAALTRGLRQAFPLRDAVGHADIAPERKTDPGPCFDWPRYRQAADWPPAG